MHKTASKNAQTRRERGLQGMERPDAEAMLRGEKRKADQRAEKLARKEAKKGPMQRIKDNWDD